MVFPPEGSRIPHPLNRFMASLARLAALPGDYRVCPGHEGLSTLEAERQQNYYMREAVRG